MVNNDHINQYSASDILRYLHGKMLPAESHALEKAALDDPFLADAIEGMQLSIEHFDEAKLQKDLDELDHRVQERVSRPKRAAAPIIAFRWWQAAAAAAVLVIAAIGVWYTMSDNKEADKVQTTLADVPQLPAPVTEEKKASAAPATPAVTDSVSGNALLQDDEIVKPEKTTREEIALSDRKEKKRQPKATIGKLGYKSDLFTSKQLNADTIISFNNPLNSSYSYTTTTPNKDNVVASNLPLHDQYRFNFDDSIHRLPNQAPTNSGKKEYDIASNANRTQFVQIVIPKSKMDSVTATTTLLKPREPLAMNLRKEWTARQMKKNPNALLSGTIRGSVTDQYNNPISNALVRVDDNQNFFTDMQGRFNIPARDSVVNVVVGYAGMYTSNVKLENNATYNNISFKKLQNDLNEQQGYLKNKAIDSSALNLSGRAAGIEVQDKPVKFRKNQAVKTQHPTVMMQEAEPEYGWLKYQQYLQKNKKLPADAHATGNVVVSFAVGETGLLSDFKIEESLGKVYDEEAVRLIKAGPSWKVNNGQRTRATVIVKF